MFEAFRPATQQEIESIAPHSDLGPNCVVMAWPNGEKPVDLFVIRNTVEVDPVFFTEGTSNQRKLLACTILENLLRFQYGANAYYFNVKSDDILWQETLKKLGAESVSTGPELRFKKVIR